MATEEFQIRVSRGEGRRQQRGEFGMGGEGMSLSHWVIQVHLVNKVIKVNKIVRHDLGIELNEY